MQPQTDEQRGKRARSISKAMKGLVAVLRRVQWTVAETGLQPSFHGAPALELIPPVWSVPMRPGAPGVEGAANWRGAR